MASKDSMISTVRTYNGYITGLSSVCADAARQIYSLLQDVEQNWWGESGSAMSYALYDAYEKMNRARAMLDDAAGQIESEAWYRYNNWPEEKEDT